jgi:hypothetical protein
MLVKLSKLWARTKCWSRSAHFPFDFLLICHIGSIFFLRSFYCYISIYYCHLLELTSLYLSLLFVVVIIRVSLWYSQISMNFCLNYHSESLIVVVLWKLFIYLKQDTIARTLMHHLIHWL